MNQTPVRPGTSIPGSPEPTLLQAARAGDLEAFRQLVLLHQAEVFGRALQLTGETSAAADLAQHVLVRLHSAMARIASPAHLRHWLSRAMAQRAFELGYKVVDPEA